MDRILGQTLSGGIFESALLIQQAGTTISSAILANLWPVLELPTAQQVQSLRDDLQTLRAQLQAAHDAVRTDADLNGPIADEVMASPKDVRLSE